MKLLNKSIILSAVILLLGSCGSKGPSPSELDAQKHLELGKIETEIDIHILKGENDSVLKKVILLQHPSDRLMPSGSSNLGTGEGWKDLLTQYTYRDYWDMKRKGIIESLK